MIERRAPGRLAALLSLLLAAPLAGAAVLPPPPPPANASDAQLLDRDVQAWVRMLRGSDRADRKLAARELRRQVRDVTQTLEHAQPGSLRALEARQQHSLLSSELERPCTLALSAPEIARPCAQMLGLLELEGGRPALEGALAAEPSFLTRKAIERALERLDAQEH